MGDNTRPAQAKVEEPAPVQKPKTPSKPQNANKPKSESTKSKGTQSDKPIFKIQFLTSDKKLPAGSKLFKGLTPVGHYQEKGIYKYTYGESHDYNKVLRTKRQISSKFKDAFIIAFKNGKKMNVNEAIKEFKNNR